MDVHQNLSYENANKKPSFLKYIRFITKLLKAWFSVWLLDAYRILSALKGESQCFRHKTLKLDDFVKSNIVDLFYHED